MSQQVHLNVEGKREAVGRACQSKKKRPINRYLLEKQEASTSTSAKKLKGREFMDFDVNAFFGYRSINFVSIFSTISEVVKCKKCNGDINLTETFLRGLGFNLKVN